MNRLISIVIFPVFAMAWKLARYKKHLEADARRWSEWKHRRFSMLEACVFFVSDKAFRNLMYYRCGRSRVFLSWLFPAYDHLQITTPGGMVDGGLIFQHGFSTIVSAKKIGKNCKIYQQVTIGYNHKLEAPELGDNVEVCCGAKIIGGVRVGNNVLIGANAVVTKDVPDNSVVAGVPARVIGVL